MSSNDKTIIESYLKTFDTSLEIIASEIMLSYENSFRNEVTELYSYFNVSLTTLETDVFSKLELNGKVKTQLTDKMKLALQNITTSIYRDFGSKVSQSKMKYAAGRAERNPVIKQTITKSNNFKTFIISQKILLDLYDILSYIDGQKYIAGLLRFPPSKIYGDIARMKYTLERVGLTTNPVFIIDEITKSVTLSSPDMLSLTGTPLFSKITRDQMKVICYIDYNKDLWNSDKIMEHYAQKSNTKKISDLKAKISKIDGEMKPLLNNKKRTPAQQQELLKKQNEKRKVEEELSKLNSSSSRGVTLSTSLNREQKEQIRDMNSLQERPVDNQQYQPRESYPQMNSYQQPQVQYPQLQQGQQGYTPQRDPYNQYQQSQVPQGQGYNPQNVQQYQQNTQTVPQNQGHLYPAFQPRRTWNNPYTKDF